MANGGWFGTQPEWERLEAPLLGIDANIDRFAFDLGLAPTKNHKDWPERSIRWGESPSNLIQIYLANADDLTWHLWIASTQDRRLERYWRQMRLIDGLPMDAFKDKLPLLLHQGHKLLTEWSLKPELYEFAGPVSPLR